MYCLYIFQWICRTNSMNLTPRCRHVSKFPSGRVCKDRWTGALRGPKVLIRFWMVPVRVSTRLYGSTQSECTTDWQKHCQSILWKFMEGDSSCQWRLRGELGMPMSQGFCNIWSRDQLRFIESTVFGLFEKGCFLCKEQRHCSNSIFALCSSLFISVLYPVITRSQTAALAAQHAVKACFATWPSYAAFRGLHCRVWHDKRFSALRFSGTKGTFSEVKSQKSTVGRMTWGTESTYISHFNTFARTLRVCIYFSSSLKIFKVYFSC